jgi:hypothetical protein
MALDGGSREQRIIDHQVLLSRTREIMERFAARERAWGDRREARQQTAWLRRQLADLIASASPEDLEALGVTDQAVREVRLGASVQAVWRRLHVPPPFADRPASADEPGGAANPPRDAPR